MGSNSLRDEVDMGQIYFYADPEVDSTIERFDGSLKKISYERTKKWKFGFPEGLGVGLEEKNKTQPQTRYERLANLKKLIGEHGELGTKRPSDRDGVHEFVLEQCRAVRVVIAENAVTGKQSLPLSFWLSPGEETQGPLCLFEGSGGDSENPYNYGRVSTYTLLQSLVYFARMQRRSSLIDRFVPDDPNPYPYSKIDETHPPSLHEQYHNVVQGGLANDFVKDPLPLLRSWGCDVSTERQIETLYRIREYGPDSGFSGKKITVFGYALSIEAAG